jgi:5S rRNA maturation endonuclease (ribonuclease M5)
MVEVFKTNIEYTDEAERIRKLLLNRFPNCQINLDLEDCDKILRIKGNVSPEAIIDIVHANNYRCEVLE